MKPALKRSIYWTPRVLCILFAIFLSLFSFDVFGEGYGFWESILAFLIHMVPVYIVIIVLVIAWWWEWVGAVIFFGLALFYLVQTWGKMHWSAPLTISGSLVLIAVLFLLNWIYRGELRGKQVS